MVCTLPHIHCSREQNSQVQRAPCRPKSRRCSFAGANSRTILLHVWPTRGMNVIDEDSPEERSFMTFAIDIDNNTSALDSAEKIDERQEGTQTSSTSQELDALAGKWPSSRLV